MGFSAMLAEESQNINTAESPGGYAQCLAAVLTSTDRHKNLKLI